jgi:hypothetical protein
VNELKKGKKSSRQQKSAPPVPTAALFHVEYKEHRNKCHSQQQQQQQLQLQQSQSVLILCLEKMTTIVMTHFL